MDDFFKSRMRVVGVVTIIIVAIFVILFIFVQYREKKNTALRLRMFYSDMSQALQYAKNLNGPPGDWGWVPGYKNIDLINSNLSNYMKVSENCTRQHGTCIPEANYKSVNGKTTTVNLYQLPAIKLQNGISFAIETVSSCQKQGSTCAVVYVDLNSIEPPNAFGKDLFVFLIINSNSAAFIPYNSRLPGFALAGDEKYGCNKKADIAMYCSALIFTNGWSIDRTYPW